MDWAPVFKNEKKKNFEASSELYATENDKILKKKLYRFSNNIITSCNSLSLVSALILMRNTRAGL